MVGKIIPANSKDNTFSFNLPSGFANKPSVVCLFPAAAKFINIRYDYDTSTASVANLIFDNDGAQINADTFVRFGVICIA